MKSNITEMLTEAGIYVLTGRYGACFVEVAPDGTCQQLTSDLTPDGDLSCEGGLEDTIDEIIGPLARKE